MRSSNQIREAAKLESNEVVVKVLIEIADLMDQSKVSESVAENMVVRGFSLSEAEAEAQKEDAFVTAARALKYI